MRGLLRRIQQWRQWPVVALAAVTYVPLLLTHRGKVGADTKTYLYLDPSRLLADAGWLWDPGIGLGTVTHQNIGYLWPMGPYYWACQQIGLPDWVAQRLWLGSVLFAAGMGVRFLLRTLNWRVPGATVAMFAYALTPFILDYAARLSVILLPYAGLGWLIAFTVRSIRNGGWRDPAAFALIAVTVGGINATSLLLVLIGPAMWVPYAIWAQRETTLTEAVKACLRIGVLTLSTSFWWMAGLMLQGKYGVPILRYTETYEVVARAATAPELLRGLGYWFFYGKDSLGPWIRAATQMTELIPVVAVSLLLPLITVTSGFLTRFRHRAYFVLLTVVGLLVSIASHPWENPSPAGRVFKAWTAYDSGLAFRSTPRAVPLLALGLAVLLAASVAWVAQRWRRLRVPYAAALIVLIFVNQLPLFTGNIIDTNLQRNEKIPTYWRQAAAYLDKGSRDTRVMEMPGIDFASYNWGNTVDPITPGLMDRDYVARELIPYGGAAAAAMLNALDGPYQEGVDDPAALAPLMRLMGVGQVVIRSDLRTGRYRTPRPRRLWYDVTHTPGLYKEATFGPANPNPPLDAVQPLEDEMALGTPTTWPQPAPVSVLGVNQPEPMLRTVPSTSPVLMAGDASGLVTAAGFGLTPPASAVVFSASLAKSPEKLRQLAKLPGASLVVTDSNRKQAWRWGSVRENHGYTERIDEKPLAPDPTDHRLDVFPDAGWDAYTVATPDGQAKIDATGYGNAVTYTGGDRAVLAFDGNLNTAWKVGAFKDVRDDYLRITWPKEVTVSSVHLVQPVRGTPNRWITQARLLFDGDKDEAGNGIDVKMTAASRTAAGQTVTFPARRTRTLRIAISDTNLQDLASYDGVSEVGLAEIGVNGVRVTDVLRPPTDLLDTVGAQQAQLPLTYLFRRAASNPEEVVIDDEEPSMLRTVDVRSPRGFAVSGKAKMPTELPDQVIDELLGVPNASQGGITATSKARLPSLRARAYSALDGDPTTAWQSPVNRAVHFWFAYDLPRPIEVRDLNLRLVTDGQHSVIRAFHLEVDGKASPTVRVPDSVGAGTDASCVDANGDARYDLGGLNRGHTTEVPVRLATPLRGTSIRFVVDDIFQECSRDWFGGGPTVLPVGVAELGLPGITMPKVPERIPDTCARPFLTIDGEVVPLRLVGSTDQALDRQYIDALQCSRPVALSAGQHRLATALGNVLDAQGRTPTGFTLDMVALRSTAAIGSESTAPGDPTSGAKATANAAPTMSIRHTTRLAYDLKMSDRATAPYWIVLSQSQNPGWHLRTADGTDLGPSQLVNGFANGWYIDPAKVNANAFVLEWTPQRTIWIALILSAAGALVCLVLALRRRPAAPQLPGVTRVIALEPADDFGDAVPWRRSLMLTGAALVAGTVLCGLVVGPVVALLTLAALRLRRGWTLLRCTAIATLTLSFAYIGAKQLLNGYPVDFSWPQRFEITHFPVVAAIALSMADVVVETVRGGWRRTSTP